MKSSSDIHISDVISAQSLFVLVLRGVMSGQALIYAPYSQFSGKKKEKKDPPPPKKKRWGGGGEASERRDLGS